MTADNTTTCDIAGGHRPPLQFALWHYGGGFDLDHQLRPGESHHLNQRAGRRLGAEVLGSKFAQRLDLCHVRDVGIDLDDIFKRGSGGSQGCLEVFQNLTRLGFEVSRTDHVARPVKRDLARDVDGSASKDFNDVRVTRRRGQCRRVGVPNRIVSHIAYLLRIRRVSPTTSIKKPVDGTRSSFVLNVCPCFGRKSSFEFSSPTICVSLKYS